MVSSGKVQISDRLPPQNIEAEEAVLGGILLDPEAISRVLEMLRPEFFALPSHQTIYRGMVELHQQGKPTDLMTVTTWLGDRDLLEKVGGQIKIASLVERTISAVNIDQYAALVVDKFLRRKLIQAGNEIVDIGYQTAIELETVLDSAEQKVFNLTQERPQQELVSISETLVNTFQDIEDRNEGVALPGLPCGFYDLDAMTGGFQRSDLIIVAGRPSMGKCCAYNTLILLEDGSLETIEAIYQKRRAKLLTLGQDWQFKITEPSAFVDDGIKPVFRVTTKLGRFVETTITHPFLTVNGWQKLSELKPGSKIAVPRKLDIFGTENIPEERVKLLADNFADGDFVSPKTVPEIVFKLNKKLLSLFINRLFSQDDSAGLLVFDKNPRLSYSTTCEQNARQLQHLLLRFEIISSLKKTAVKYQTSSDKIWQLEISEVESLKKFIDEIGISVKKEILALFKEGVEQREGSSNLGENSEVYWDEIVAIESVGEKQVYDLTIPETSNFVANDICVHNTSFAINIAHNIAIKQKLPIAIFSMEMSKEQLVQRLLASEAKIESNRLRAGRISQNEWEPLIQAIGTLSEQPIFIDDTPNITVNEMRSKTRRLQTENGGALGLILLDYLQLMEGSGSDNRVQELSRITRSLKGLARELSVPIITLSQLSRSVETRTNKRPMMSDLRESGSIEQDADLVIMLYREEYYNPDTPDRGIAEVIITKHRNGPVGTIKLLFDSQFTRFRNLATPRH
jgi:replicative DNA helicase